MYSNNTRAMLVLDCYLNVKFGMHGQGKSIDRRA